MNSLSRRYAEIGPLIIKIERLILGTNSGTSKCLANYYIHWEQKVLDSLLKMVER